MNSIVNKIKWIAQAGIIVILLTGSAWLSVYGQLQVGDTLPLHRFEELKRTSSAEFPGSSQPKRLYILDFWSKWCGSCIVSFPKVEGLQYQFRHDIKIVAINPWNDDKEVTELFEKNHAFKVKQEQVKQSKDNSWKGSEFKPRKTTLPALNGDKKWLNLFEIKGVPHHIWISDIGKVIAVTSSYDVNADNIEYYLRTGILPNMAAKTYPESYNLGEYSLKNLWGKNYFPYQNDGLLMRDFHSGDGGSVFGYQRTGVVDSLKKTIRYSFVNTSIADLYKAAWALSDTEHYRPQYDNGFFAMEKGDTFKYADVLNERLLWEVSVPEYFIGPVNKNYVTSDAPGFDEWSLRSKFCAELELPLNKQQEAGRMFLKGLNRYFHEKFGIAAKIERRKRYCLVLKKTKLFQQSNSIASKTAYRYYPEHKVEKYLNHPFKIIFLDYLPYRIDHNYGERYWTTSSRGNHFAPRLTRNFPLLDETGIDGNLNIDLHIVPVHIRDPLQALNMRLKGTGLYIEKDVRDIDMLVISDHPYSDRLIQ